MQHDNNENASLVFATTDVDYEESRIDYLIEAIETMFDELPESTTNSQLSMRLAHLMLANDSYAMRGDHKSALLCLQKAEPIVLKFVEWSKHNVNARSISFFLECYIRNGSFEEARLLVSKIMTIIKKRCHFSRFEALRNERKWILEIDKAQAVREKRQLRLAELDCSELNNPLIEFHGLEKAIDGYFELIHKVRNTA